MRGSSTRQRRRRSRAPSARQPLTPDAMRMVPASTAAASHSSSSRFSRPGLVHAVEQGVERDLADDVAAIAALVVDVVRVPFAEDVVGPAVDRMAVIVGPHVQRQFVQQVQIELGLREQRRVGRFQDLQCRADEVVIAAPGRPGAADVQRHGPMAFVVVGFALRPRLQNGDRPIADEIVEPVQDAGDGPRLRRRSGTPWASTASKTRTRKNGVNRSRSSR